MINKFTCPECKDGILYGFRPDWDSGINTSDQVCPTCKGKKFVSIGVKCENCGGEGKPGHVGWVYDKKGDPVLYMPCSYCIDGYRPLTNAELEEWAGFEAAMIDIDPLVYLISAISMYELDKYTFKGQIVRLMPKEG